MLINIDHPVKLWVSSLNFCNAYRYHWNVSFWTKTENNKCMDITWPMQSNETIMQGTQWNGLPEHVIFLWLNKASCIYFKEALCMHIYVKFCSWLVVMMSALLDFWEMWFWQTQPSIYSLFKYWVFLTAMLKVDMLQVCRTEWDKLKCIRGGLHHKLVRFLYCNVRKKVNISYVSGVLKDVGRIFNKQLQFGWWSIFIFWRIK